MNETYEAVFIIKDYKDTEKIKGIIKEIDEIVINEGYEIYNRKDYGRKNLAYEVMKEQKGYYYVINFSDVSKKKNAREKVKRNINTMEDVLVFIIIKKENKEGRIYNE